MDKNTFTKVIRRDNNMSWLECPNCKKIIGGRYTQTECPHCGQKILWY